MKKLVFALLVFGLVQPGWAQMLDWSKALKGDHRTPEYAQRDDWRHPQQTLEFFGLEPGMTVLEISPGGGWYTEVLAPLVTPTGTLYAAHFSPNAPHPYFRKSLGEFLLKLAEHKDIYQPVVVTQLSPPAEVTPAPAESVDLALAFRNVHSWMRGGSETEVLAAIYKAVKPGGVFGVVQHSDRGDKSLEDMKKTGYVSEAQVIKLIEAAGFKLMARSDINANPKDTTDHPSGVWTLAPSFAQGDKDKAKYAAIGESNRMTLKFVKPE